MSPNPILQNHCCFQNYFDENVDEPPKSMNKLKQFIVNDEEEKKENIEIKSLRCTFDLAGFHSMPQPMYRCQKCKVNICQSCELRCHKHHPLNFEGFKFNASCDCQCTTHKGII